MNLVRVWHDLGMDTWNSQTDVELALALCKANYPQVAMAVLNTLAWGYDADLCELIERILL